MQTCPTATCLSGPACDLEAVADLGAAFVAAASCRSNLVPPSWLRHPAAVTWCASWLRHPAAVTWFLRIIVS